MPANEVLTEKRGQSLILTFNRPDRLNALTFDMANQIFTALKNATVDKSVRAIVFCGAGDHFMDGLELSVYEQNFDKGLEEVNQLIAPFHSAIREIRTMEKPVISVVSGRVSGVGLSLMLASDLVIAARSTCFNTGFVKSGQSPNGGCSYYLSRKVGLSRAVELMMSQQDFDSEMAEKINIVNKVVADDQLEAEATLWLEELTAGPTKVYGAVKKLAAAAFEQTLNQQLSLEHSCFGQIARSFDFREAIKSNAAKKSPRFTGT